MTQRHVLARRAVVDCVKGYITIDGIRFPWYVAEGVEVDTLENLLTLVRFELLVDGPVTMIADAGPWSADADGPIADSIREWVRNEYRQAFPWLRTEEDE
jgi:hypothetical protein